MGGEQCHMIAKHVNGTTKTTTARTAEDAPATPTTGNRPMARIRISIDRLPSAPEPTLPVRAWEKVDTFAGIEHDYRVRKAVKKKNVRKERER